MSSNISTKDYCYKFINHLLEMKVIVGNRIEKELARTIYMVSFKPNNKRGGFPFSAMYYALKVRNFIQHDIKYLIFNEQVLIYGNDQIPNEQSAKDGKGNSRISKPNRKRSKIFKCNICSSIAYDEASYKMHLKADRHVLLNNYVNNRKLMVNPITGIRIDIKETSGLLETFILRPNQKYDYQLKILNYSGVDYSIDEVMELIPKNGIKMQKIGLPFLLENRKTIIMNITAEFVDVVYDVYSLIFRLQNVKSGKRTDVLKEMVFHVHSTALDHLHAIQPFTKQKVPTEVEILTGVVRGEHMEKNKNDFVPAILLPQFQLSNDLILILNNGFNDFDGMTRQQSFMLRTIRSLLRNFKFQDKQKLTEHNHYEMLRLLLFLEEYQMKIDIAKYSIEGAVLLKPTGFRNTCLELQVPGLGERRPSVLRGDSVYIKETKDSSARYEGIVHNVQADSVILGFASRFTNNVHLPNKKYYVTFGFNRLPLRAEHQAINLMNDHRAISILCKSNLQPKEKKNHQILWYNTKIKDNEEQQQAIRNILSQTARPMPYLIFGPPGTGKTVTIVEAVLQVWKLLNTKHILVCAPSNNAADEVTKRLVKVANAKRDLIRYVAPSYPYELLYEEVKPYVNYRDKDYYHPSIATLLEYRIVVTTLINASRLVNGGTPKGHFEFVFIDEAGQATESETLIPIAGILTSQDTKGALNGQIVLAGDPKQLGPIIHSTQAMNYKFDVSMLERLMTDVDVYKKNKKTYNQDVITKLIKCYRSHPAILKVPNDLFYDKQLQYSADEDMTHIAVDWEHLPNPKFPVIFHSIYGKDVREQNSPSFFNLQEIDVVLNYLGLLIGNRLHGIKISEEHIGIIAPYRKQVSKLQQACSKKHYGEKLFIGAVEQFQGQERHIIIITTVRSRPEFTNFDTKFHLGFLKNPKRFNVAITRPKALLIVVGNPDILMSDPNWYAFIKHCYDNKSVKGTPFNMGPPPSDLPPPSNSDMVAKFGAMKIDDVDVANAEEERSNCTRDRN